MIAFDLDGVFINDIIFDDTQVEEMCHIRNNLMLPLFQMVGDYCIITGRPIQDSSGTVEWIDRTFVAKPSAIFHGNKNASFPEEYKLSVLNSNPLIKLFIESDARQVEFLRKHCKTKIVLFSDIILRGINEAAINV